MLTENKYAIYAYTHGPVTGQIDSMQLTSGSSRRAYSRQLLSAQIDSTELRVPPPRPSLPYSANVNLTARLSALAVRKTYFMSNKHIQYFYISVEGTNWNFLILGGN